MQPPARDPLSRHLLTHAFNNAWANHRLLTACRQLSQADFIAPRTSFFPSIKATLNHNLTVDWYYIDAIRRSLDGEAPNPRFAAFFDPREPFDTCGALHAAQHGSDGLLIALCRRLDADVLQTVVSVPRSIRMDHEPIDRLLAHLFQHQTHHRGQAHAMLSGTSVKPPQLDEFFCVGDAPLRAPDFSALDFSALDFSALDFSAPDFPALEFAAPASSARDSSTADAPLLGFSEADIWPPVE